MPCQQIIAALCEMRVHKVSCLCVQIRPIAERAWQLPADTMPAIQGAALIAAGLLQVTPSPSQLLPPAFSQATPWPQSCLFTNVSNTASLTSTSEIAHGLMHQTLCEGGG